MFLFSLQAVPRAVDNQRHQEAPAGLREARGFLSNTVTRTDTNASTSTRLVSVSLVRVILVSVSLVCGP